MKDTKNKPILVLYADDDPEDRMLAKDAFEESEVVNDIFFVEDGEQLMDYLQNKGDYQDEQQFPQPGLILLDLNMPRKDGWEALKEIKSCPKIRHIPVIMLTTSKADEDVLKSYDLGSSSFITKPVTFEGLVDIIQTLGKYWFEIVELPKN